LHRMELPQGLWDDTPTLRLCQRGSERKSRSSDEELLKEAAVREARPHNARHNAATVLLMLGISQRVIMGPHGLVQQRHDNAPQHLTPDICGTSRSKSTACSGCEMKPRMRPPTR
jgi:hypothetical protein